MVSSLILAPTRTETMGQISKQEQARFSKSKKAIDAFDASEQGKPAAKPKKPKKKPHKEKVGVKLSGNAALNAQTDKRMQPVRERLRASVLTKDKGKAGKLRQILLAMQQTKLRE